MDVKIVIYQCIIIKLHTYMHTTDAVVVANFTALQLSSENQPIHI